MDQLLFISFPAFVGIIAVCYRFQAKKFNEISILLNSLQAMQKEQGKLIADLKANRPHRFSTYVKPRTQLKTSTHSNTHSSTVTLHETTH